MQDMPPVGGFPSIRIQRRLPSTGPTGVAIFAVGGAVMAYGYYQVCLTQQSHTSVGLDLPRTALCEQGTADSSWAAGRGRGNPFVCQQQAAGEEPLLCALWGSSTASTLCGEADTICVCCCTHCCRCTT